MRGTEGEGLGMGCGRLGRTGGRWERRDGRLGASLPTPGADTRVSVCVCVCVCVCV